MLSWENPNLLPLSIGFGIVILTVALRTLTRKSKSSLKGKRILITGASSGIGEELAYQYAKIGTKLILTARRLDRLQSVANKCRELGSEAIAVKTDVSKEDECKNMVDEAVKSFGGIDTLVLNAGVGCLLKFSEVTKLSMLREVMDANYWGCVAPTFYTLSHLRKSKGTIIVVSSLASKLPTPRRTHYAATKSAVNAFFNCLRQEEPDIQITIVCPGFVVTELHDKAIKTGPMTRDLSKFMSAERCAEIIVDAAVQGKREEIMTPSGKFGSYMRVFFPSLIDGIAARTAERSVVKE